MEPRRRYMPHDKVPPLSQQPADILATWAEPNHSSTWYRALSEAYTQPCLHDPGVARYQPLGWVGAECLPVLLHDLLEINVDGRICHQGIDRFHILIVRYGRRQRTRSIGKERQRLSQHCAERSSLLLIAFCIVGRSRDVSNDRVEHQLELIKWSIVDIQLNVRNQAFGFES